MQSCDPARLRTRFFASLGLLAPLLYLGAGLPLPAALQAGPGALTLGFVQLALALGVCWLGRDLFAAARQAVRARTLRAAPLPPLLLALGASLALLYGAARLLRTVVGAAPPDALGLDLAAALPAAHTGLAWAQALALRRDTAPLTAALAAAPRTARVLRDGKPAAVPAQEVEPGELFLVKPGEGIPADGTVAEGVSAVDASALTGRAAAVQKSPGAPLCAGSVNGSGALVGKAVRTGRDTTLAQAAQRLAAALHRPVAPAQILPALAGRTLPPRLPLWLALGALALLALAALLGGWPRAVGVAALLPGFAALALLAAPAVLRRALGDAAGQGLWFRDLAALLDAAALRAVLLGREGVLTCPEPGVVAIVGSGRVPEKFLLSMAAGLARSSDHPLARAILQRAGQDGIQCAAVADVEAVPGQGLRGKVAGKVLAGGSAAFLRSGCPLPPALEQAGREMEQNGVTPLYFSLAGSPAGIVGVSDVLPRTAAPAVAQLRALGLEVRLLTGQPAAEAQRLAAAIGLDAAHTAPGTPPAQQAEAVRAAQAQAGPAAMAGSGEADAEALRAAALGVTVGAADRALTPDAGLAVMQNDLTALPAAIALARGAVQEARRTTAAVLAAAGAALVLALGGLLPPAPAFLLAAAACAAALYAPRPHPAEEERHEP